jgi:transcriptional regulator with AAA-type ATPase domain
MIYLTFVGNHDALDKAREGYGAALTIFLQYKAAISDVYIFVTSSKGTDRVNYQEIAESSKAIMLAEKPHINVTLVAIDLPNPVDFDLVYPTLLHETQKLLEREEIKTQEKIINITSGTPTMTTCWVLLHKSGLIPNSRLVQSFETKYARERGKSTQEVNLEIDDFPQITAPEELKRQLTIVSRKNIQLTEQLNASELDRQIAEIVGQSRPIREIKEQILKDVDTETHVLILGERGTGKQVVAEAIWRLYHREKDKVLTTFDCGAFSETLLLSELFGHKKGAFTGATEDRTGLLKQCDNRMLFLDEIGNLPMTGQQALLRFVNDGEMRPLGSNTVYKVKTQIIAATNKNIYDSTLFAQDLKDRFDEIIELTPLRHRKEDIPLLIDHFLLIFSKKQGTRTPLTLRQEVVQKLQEYDWPGNVRELEKWIQKLCRRFEGGELSLKDLPAKFILNIMRDEEMYELPDLPLPIPLKDYIDKIRERARLQAGGNMAVVDRLLGQNPGTEKQRRYRRKQKDSS